MWETDLTFHLSGKKAPTFSASFSHGDSAENAKPLTTVKRYLLILTSPTLSRKVFFYHKFPEIYHPQATCLTGATSRGDPFCQGNLGMHLQMLKMWPRTSVVLIYEGGEESIDNGTVLT